jgi:hypothetical protein
VQTAIIKNDGDKYRFLVLQNTPAAYHGRPGDSEDLTDELKKELALLKGG